MTVEATLVAALRDMVAGRVFPDVAPEATLRPYITYQQVAGEPVNFVDPTVPSKKNAWLQVNVWADTRSQAATLSRQIEDTLRQVAPLQTTVLNAPTAVYEEATKLRGTMQDFSFWFDS